MRRVRGLPWWYQALISIAVVLALVALWLTLLTDPGALTPAHAPDPLAQLLDAGLPVLDGYVYQRDPRGATWLRRTPTSKPDVWIAKYCPTCHIWRPPRSHHCGECGVCMEHWDHHCGIVGNCIAKKNHRFFAGFLVSAQIGCLLLLGGAIWHLELRGVPTPGRWMGTESFIITFLAVVYGYHGVLLLFGTMHCLSILLDITTKDLLTDKHLCSDPPCCPGTRSPMNLLQSWRAMCCSPIAYRPYHGWRRLPTDDAAAEMAVTGLV
eukprot:GHUV01026629.1.p1 GENE.GHUV01026629.1~~GHUV01026629.1.p1  ORF type:complete len:266 (+),score=40.75 GHUV01026629.1:503-1300(+)